MTRIGLVLSLIVGGAALAWAYSRAGLDGAARIPILVAASWMVAQWRRWRWFPALGLGAFIVLAAYGLWIGLPAGLMVIGAIGGLAAWDLADFTVRLRYASPMDNVRDLERRHVARLLIVVLLGFLLAGIATFVRLQLTFEVVFVLVVLAAVGLAQLLRWLGERGD